MLSSGRPAIPRLGAVGTLRVTAPDYLTPLIVYDCARSRIEALALQRNGPELPEAIRDRPMVQARYQKPVSLLGSIGIELGQDGTICAIPAWSENIVS